MFVSEAKLLANRRNARAVGTGRPQGSIEETTAYRRAFLKTLNAMIDKEKVPLIRAMLKEATAGNVEAFKALLDRAQGKPAQAVELGGTDGAPIVFMPLELIQKHALEVIDATPQISAPVQTETPK